MKKLVSVLLTVTMILSISFTTFAANTPTADYPQKFWDVSKNHWANTYINTAKDYLAAYADGSFKPDQAAAREDVTVSMVKLKGYDISNVDYSYLRLC